MREWRVGLKSRCCAGQCAEVSRAYRESGVGGIEGAEAAAASHTRGRVRGHERASAVSQPVSCSDLYGHVPLVKNTAVTNWPS
eukprot:5172203-Prymnesium_polylepis.1